MFICVAISGFSLYAGIGDSSPPPPPFIHNAISFLPFSHQHSTAAFNTSRDHLHYNFPFLSVVAT